MSAPITSRFDRRRVTNILTHVIFIVILCVLPEVLVRMSWRTPHSMPWGVYAKSGVMVIVFYINYFFIIPRTLQDKQRWWRFAAINIAIILAATVAMYFVAKWGWGPGGKHIRKAPDEWHRMAASASFMLRDAIMLILTVSLAVAIKLSGLWRDLDRRRENLLALRRESELEGLRSQLNPHFLFNTLNSIYALIAISPADAQAAVHQLSQLLRQVVYDSPERVTVGREVEFLQHYIALMRLRLGSRPVSFTTDIENPDTPVAPLLFMTLVENACKHGATAPADAPIEIAVVCRGGQVECRTANHFRPGIAHTEGRTATHGGVGLANLRRRIELLYGSRASLVTAEEGDSFHATLKINLQ